MPRRDATQEAIDRLNALRDVRTPEARELLREVLAEERGLAVKRAATMIADSRLEGFQDSLEAAFRRLQQRGVDRDPSCYGKIAILSALHKLELPSDVLYIEATRCVQEEPAFGGAIDTAAEVRAMAIIALAESGSPQMLDGAVNLLLDDEIRVRIGAVRALITDGSRAAVLLLRFKTLQGDVVEVMDECLRGLAERDPGALPILSSFVANEDQLARAAVLAIGESHLSGAFEYLRDALDNVRREGMEQAILLAIAMQRSEAAIKFLIEQVRDGSAERCEMAEQALNIYAGDRELEARVEEALEERHAGRFNRQTATKRGRR